MTTSSKVYVLLKHNYGDFKHSAVGTGTKVTYLKTDMVKHRLWELLICSIRSENTLRGMFVNLKE
jgi:hypothetical protein